MKNAKIGVAVVVVVLVLGYMFASPYITVNQMKAAVRNHNADALSEHVDFPALRQSLKEQLNASFLKKMAQEVEDDNQFAAFGVALGGVVVEKMVDVAVTPAGITQIMSGQQFGFEESGGALTGQVQKEPFADATMSYESFKKFVITVRDSESGENVKYVLKRKGMGWKLSEIMLPL